MPKTTALASLDAWVHYPQNILNIARLTHLTPVPPEDSEITEEEMMAKILETDPMVDRLRAINMDAPLAPYKTAWIHKFVGDL
jgi:hypothetical protein